MCTALTMHCVRVRTYTVVQYGGSTRVGSDPSVCPQASPSLLGCARHSTYTYRSGRLATSLYGFVVYCTCVACGSQLFPFLLPLLPHCLRPTLPSFPPSSPPTATNSTSAKLEIFQLNLSQPGLSLPLVASVESPLRYMYLRDKPLLHHCTCMHMHMYMCISCTYMYIYTVRVHCIGIGGLCTTCDSSY